MSRKNKSENLSTFISLLTVIPTQISRKNGTHSNGKQPITNAIHSYIHRNTDHTPEQNNTELRKQLQLQDPFCDTNSYPTEWIDDLSINKAKKKQINTTKNVVNLKLLLIKYI